MKRPSLFLAALAILALLAVGWSASAQSGYAVIVNADNPVSSLSKDDVSRFLLKKRTKWENDDPVEPIDLEDSSSVREAFSRDIHGRSVSSIKNYWQRQIFSGRAVPPPEVSGDADVIARVRSNRGAIGYVSKGAGVEGVKVIRVSD